MLELSPATKPPIAYRVAIATLCVLAFSSVAHAQSTFGTVLGTVLDPSGSVVAKAKVELFNTGTNAVRETESTESGAYQ
ncbi:MAG: carboxypeptidase-like regulatory domain-containing protein, partial [Bryobacteraceae bacterium]